MIFLRYRCPKRSLGMLLALWICQAWLVSTTHGQANPAASSPQIGGQGEDWPRFLGPRYDGKSSETGIQKDWGAGRLRSLWSLPVGTSYGIGSVRAGRYIQHVRVGDEEQLQAVQADTGAPLWIAKQPVVYEDMYGYNNGPRDTPAIESDFVYSFGVAGQLTCTDVSTGTIKWTENTNQKYGVVQNFFGVGSSPLVLDDLVIVMVGGSPPEDASIAPGRLDRVSSNGSALVAFDRRTGVERWRTGDDLASYSSPRPNTVEGKTFVLLLARDHLLAIEPQKGRLLWKYPHRASILESVNAMVPVVVDDRVFISDCYEIGSALLKVSADKYEVLWKEQDNRRQQIFRGHWATPVELNGFLFGCSGRNEPDSDLRCIDLLNQRLAWADQRRSRVSLMSVDRHLIVLDEGGLLQLVSADSRQMKVITSIDLEEPDPVSGRPALGVPYWSAPILSHGRLYVRGSQRVACFELIPASTNAR